MLMSVLADLQIHSKYSRAVSQKMNLQEISSWAERKGINLVATGDWTHPLWFKEIKEGLKETSEGIYSLVGKNHDLSQPKTKFLLSTEISSIYSQGGKVRRVHNLIFSPSIETCQKVIAELKKRGVLSEEEAGLLRTLAGYRNRLVHFYHEVEAEELFSISALHLEDVERLGDAFRGWLDDHPEKLDEGL